ncbi:PA-phosphatase related-family protein [Fusarium oxysporum f. sp. albedinis]|nr:PA-phosphatase related-family protein [Fusarium oxysporum f. sp. albedinis]
MTLDKVHVLIIGAVGATGLLIAQGLKRSNISVEVFERQSYEKYIERAGAWGMALHWSTPNVEACLPPKLFEQLQTAQTDPWTVLTDEDAKTIPMVNGKTGELLTYVKAEGPRRVHRGRLRDLFRNGVDVHFGMELTDFSVEGDIVTARFNNGSEARKGFYLVGADGRKSLHFHMRQLVKLNFTTSSKQGPQFSCAPRLQRITPISPHRVCKFISQAHPCLTLGRSLTHYRILATRLRLNKLVIFAARFILLQRSLGPHPDQNTYFFLTRKPCLQTIFVVTGNSDSILLVADVPDPDKPETWVFQLSLSLWNEGQQPETFEERVRIFKELAANYCEPFKSVAEWVGEDVKITLSDFSTWKKIQPWKNYNGRVTITGDAAHPMVPYRAQGLNNALEDAGQYVRAIVRVVNGEEDLASAIRSYDADAYKRGKNDVGISDAQMYACHHWDALQKSSILADGFGKSE